MTGEALAAAVRIGRSLCETAYWDEERRHCNWMGRADREGPTPGSLAPGTAALEPDVYRGSAGVALFLAELFAVTGDAELLRTAAGAVRRSIRVFLTRPLERARPLSYFLGHLGAACVAQRVLELAPEAADLEAAIDPLLAEVERSLSEPHPLDLLGGNGGAIPALLRLARTPGRQDCAALAERCGRELCAAADRDGTYARWPPERAAGPETAMAAASLPLTGLSHGASGMALALAELSAWTGDASYLEIANEAFAYEDTFFNPAANNWRDVRDAVGVGSFQTAWCHGAPGIGLARLRAMELDPSLRDAHAATARIAAGTAVKALAVWLAAPRYDATLCHGIAGLSEIVLTAGHLLGDGSYLAAAAEAAGELIRRYGPAGDWPSGMPSGGPSPALMLGTAGIGYHFLRIHDPGRVPPVLVVGR
ncbi:MAG TPA: lanthionine synthetase LanC family protein [Thermoanaerobaculia bacterium]|nr:lanthionine synthetase LanC family protein [Thermoanaerobaculia bacterium]